MIKNVIQINGEILINVNASVKTSCMWKKMIFGILLHAVAKMKKDSTSIMDDSVITCDQITESYYEELNFNESNL